MTYDDVALNVALSNIVDVVSILSAIISNISPIFYAFAKDDVNIRINSTSSEMTSHTTKKSKHNTHKKL